VVESSLEGELDDHLGYSKHDPVGANNGNSRNGKRAKTLLTDAGTVQIEIPRDYRALPPANAQPDSHQKCESRVP
jgi:transposase-like protein